MTPSLRSYVSPNVFVHVPWSSTDAADREDNLTEQERDEQSRSQEGQSISDKHDKSKDAESRSESSNSVPGSTSVSKPRSRLRLLFFIPGNPGLIGYYHPFLSLLVQGLGRKDDTESQTVVVGLSLGGFEIQADDRSTTEKRRSEGRESEADEGVGEDDRLMLGSDANPIVNAGVEEEDREEEQVLLYPAPVQTFHQGRQNQNRTKLFTLRDQTELSYARLESLIERIRQDPARDDPPQEQGQEEETSIEVVLAGHSVGAYICLELVRLWHERQQRYPKSSDLKSPAWRPSTCILLTPTIQDIHLSRSGLIATPLLTNVSFLPSLAQFLVRNVLLKCLPAAWFVALVSQVTGMEHGSHGLEATSAFLRSEKGVEQALYMAGWEMKEIRADKWGQEVWGASDEVVSPDVDGPRESGNPNLFFWFAKEDHWVADVTKKAIANSGASNAVMGREHISELAEEVELHVTAEARIKGGQRGDLVGRNLKLRIQESEGLVHAWCLGQSEIVARRVIRWLEA